MRVLSWNLGPGNVRWQELGAVLAGWDWDVSMLRRLPGRWPLPLATALDAEFRYARTAGPNSRLRRLLERRPPIPAAAAGGEVAVILARRDRIVAQWPNDPRLARRTGVHAARLACGIWIANVTDATCAPAQLHALRTGTGTGDAALALAAPRSLAGLGPLTEVAHAGEDAIWASGDLRPVSGVDVLAAGPVRGNPPLAVTLEHRVPRPLSCGRRAGRSRAT